MSHESPGADEAPPTAAAPVRTLIRGLVLLEIIATMPHGAGVTELAEAAGLDKGTTSRLLATLRHLGYVRQRTTDRRFLLNGKVLSLARAYESQLDLRETMRPHLIRLRDTTRETVHSAIREGRYVVYLDQLESKESVRTVSAEGMSRPLHVTAMGRAILAALPEPVCEGLLDRLLSDHQFEDLVTDLDTIREELDEARSRGWASVERHDDVCRIGVAILDATGQPVGAISVSGPKYRMKPLLLDCASSALDTARAISHELGAGPASTTSRDPSTPPPRP